MISLSIFSEDVDAASIELEPNNGNITLGCTTQLQVFVDSAGANSNAVDLEITFDPNKIQISDSNSDKAGIQVAEGDAYSGYVYNLVDNSVGNIKLAAASSNDLNGRKLLATIFYQTINSTSTADFTINFQGSGNTLDSNVAATSTSLDLLDSVVNASYTVSGGNCTTDTTAPTINAVLPQPDQNNFPRNSDLVFEVNDNDSGVDISSLQVTLNGQVYFYDSPYISYEGSPVSYVITLDPPTDLPANSSSTVRYTISDLVSNTASVTFDFNTPPPASGGSASETTPPEIIVEYPESQAEISSTDKIIFILKDAGSGIDINSLIININGTELDITDARVSYEGDKSEYRFEITAPELLKALRNAFLDIFVQDLDGNAAHKLLTFIIADAQSEPPAKCDCPEDQNENLAALEDWIMHNNYIPDFIKNFVQRFGIVPAINILSAFTLAPLLALAGLSIVWPGFSALILSLFRRRKFFSGIVTSSNSTTGLPFTRLHLLDKNTNNIIEKTVSGLYGKYTLTGPSGSYILQAEKSGYKPASIPVQIENNHFVSSDILLSKLNQFSLMAQLENASIIALRYLYIFFLLSLLVSLVLLIVTGLLSAWLSVISSCLLSIIFSLVRWKLTV